MDEAGRGPRRVLPSRPPGQAAGPLEEILRLLPRFLRGPLAGPPHRAGARPAAGSSLPSLPPLRPYQERAVASVRRALAEGRRPILVAPTGSGKTRMAVEIAAGRRTLWIAHRRELLAQAAAALRAEGARVGLLLASEPPDPEAPVQVASVQTLARRVVPPHDLLVVDEAAHAPASSYVRHVSGAPAALGLTATPFRLDGKGLGRVGFDEIVVAATVRDLCAEGWLVEPEVVALGRPDLSRVRRRGGDYADADLAALMGEERLIGDVLDRWRAIAGGRRTVVFCVNRAHARAVSLGLLSRGVRAGVVLGDTPPAERADVLARLAAGEIQAVVSCDVLTEGWDLPALEVALVLRPTLSLCLHLQMLGRIMRACPDKAGALVLDAAGNHEAHGHVDRALVYSLSDAVRDAPATVREREEAGLPQGRRTAECPNCRRLWPPRVPVCACGVLLRRAAPADVAASPEAVAAFAERSRFFARMSAIARRNGWKPAAPRAAYKARFGAWPLAANGRLLCCFAHADDAERGALVRQWSEIGEAKRWPPGKAAWFAGRLRSEAERRPCERAAARTESVA